MKMKNYWLDRRVPKKITNEELEPIVIQYKDYPDAVAKEKLADAFYQLAEMVVDCWSVKFPTLDKDDAIQECVMMGFDKIDRYDPDKGKAFNFFITCMLGILRQSYRAVRNYQELKERYKEYLIKTQKGTVLKFAPEQIQHINIGEGDTGTVLKVHRDKPQKFQVLKSGYGVSMRFAPEQIHHIKFGDDK